MKEFTISIVAALAFFIAGSLPVPARAKVFIKVTGDRCMLGRVRGLALLYQKEHPRVDIVLSGGPNAAIGLKALVAGESQVAMTSRRINAREMKAAQGKGLRLVERLVGYGGVVLITNRENPTGEITVNQAKKLLTGEIGNWKELGGRAQAVTVFRVGEMDSDTRMYVENGVLGGEPVSKNAITVRDFPSVVRKVGDTPGSLGLVRMRDPYPGPEARTKSLKIRGDDDSPPVDASIATISDGTYPLRRPFYFYTVADSGEEVRGFVDFVADKGWTAPVLTIVWQ